jgi:hypothetical protein
MALKRVEGTFVFGPEGAGAGQAGMSGVIAKSTQRKFTSEVELVGGDGELADVVYSGPEETTTETKYDSTFNHGQLGSGAYGTGIIIRASISYSNEDMAKVEVEKIKKL